MQATLKNKGTRWCLADGDYHITDYLKTGDLVIFYSEDKHKQPTLPRVCIHLLKGGEVNEVRGILDKQELEPELLDKTMEELAKYRGGDKYFKKAADMKLLTQIYKKQEKQSEPVALTKEELQFLYELHDSIEGFGREKDPRVIELRSKRNLETDMPIVFECAPAQIARNPDQINKNTKAYVGKFSAALIPILEKHETIEYAYDSFPESGNRLMESGVGGKTETAWETELQEKEAKGQIHISEYAWDMVNDSEFEHSLYDNADKPREQWQLKNFEAVKLLRLQVRHLFGDENTHTTQEIYQRAQELGLELCPPEVGPSLLLQYAKQPLNQWSLIAMKQIPDRRDDPNVFRLERGTNGLWLEDHSADPASEWHPESEWCFRLRKSKT